MNTSFKLPTLTDAFSVIDKIYDNETFQSATSNPLPMVSTNTDKIAEETLKFQTMQNEGKAPKNVPAKDLAERSLQNIDKTTRAKNAIILGIIAVVCSIFFPPILNGLVSTIGVALIATGAAKLGMDAYKKKHPEPEKQIVVTITEEPVQAKSSKLSDFLYSFLLV